MGVPSAIGYLMIFSAFTLHKGSGITGHYQAFLQMQPHEMKLNGLMTNDNELTFRVDRSNIQLATKVSAIWLCRSTKIALWDADNNAVPGLTSQT